MKIAVVTEDENTISMHFGRAPYYLIFTVEEDKIIGKELRDKLGHRQFANEPSHEETGAPDPRGHGFGKSSEDKHNRMIEAIKDCEVIIVNGMGRGAYIAMEQANIRPFVSDIADAEEAVKAYIDGNLVDHTEKLH